MKVSFESKANGTLSQLVISEYPYIDIKNIKRQITLKEAKVDGVRVSRDVDVNFGEKVDMFFPESMIPKVSIKYADDNIVIAYKDAGLETVGQFDLLIKTKYTDSEPLHRLDRNTRGLVVFARGGIVDCLPQGVRKFYLAEVVGKVKNNKATLNAYLFKDSKKSLVYISDKAKVGYMPIATAYKVIEYRPHTTLLEVELITGRTHQIRAHLKHIGHPLAGDGKYGDNRFNKEFGFVRQQLCAYKLIFDNMPPPLEYMSGKVFEV
ncbi:MAG: RluA family pseudouridine synthase [Firmicutes bacterium]|nr:RluA family pseudouridine synthase [Bacillota bacterium]